MTVCLTSLWMSVRGIWGKPRYGARIVHANTASIKKLHTGRCVTVSTFVHPGAPSLSLPANSLAVWTSAIAVLYSSSASLSASRRISAFSFSLMEAGRNLSAILSTTLPTVFFIKSPMIGVMVNPSPFPSPHPLPLRGEGDIRNLSRVLEVSAVPALYLFGRGVIAEASAPTSAQILPVFAERFIFFRRVIYFAVVFQVFEKHEVNRKAIEVLAVQGL